jgi:hypothetical protein
MAAQKAVLRIDFHPNMMEYKPPTGIRPALAECMARVDDSHAVIVFVGRRYGWKPPDQPPPGGKSITWLECQRAADSGKEILAYFVQSTSSEAEPTGGALQEIGSARGAGQPRDAGSPASPLTTRWILESRP